jgi:hypothetical protein
MRAVSFLFIIYVQGIVSDISCKADITSFRSLPELSTLAETLKYDLHNLL